MVLVLAVIVVVYLKIQISDMATSTDFRMRRIIAWLNPEANSDKDSYQFLQGLYAIGSGGFFGKGLGNSTQKLSAIPEAQNDMILTVICEELGVFGAILINYGLIPNEDAITFLKEKPERMEIVLTGRNPDMQLIELADYVSEIKKRKHPFDRGIYARKGIEY